MRGVLFAGLLLCLLPVHSTAHAQNAPAAPPRDPVLVTISKETTRITEPLKESGYPDFLEALNLRAKRKLTPQANGVILVLKCVGLREKNFGLTDDQKQELIFRLGIDDSLQTDTVPLTYSETFVNALEESELPEPNVAERKLELHSERIEEIRSRVHREFVRCSEEPWQDDKHTLVAKWLKTQEPALSHLAPLRDYPEAYLPLVRGEKSESLIAMDNPLVHPLRTMIFELNIRAMHSLGSRNTNAAIDDFERMLILRSYLQQNMFGMIGRLDTFAMASSMHSLFNHLTMLETLQTKQCDRIEALFNRYYVPAPSIIELTDRDERLYAIDTICNAAEFGLEGTPAKPLPLKKRQQFDYDLMLTQLNNCYDRLLAAARIEKQENRIQAINELNDEVYQTKKASESKATEFLATLSKQGRSKLFADRMQALFLPAMDAAMEVELKDQMRRELWQVAIALRKYRQQNGNYPSELKLLSPQFLATIPRDRFADKPLQYRSDGRGLLLYSIGRDRVDHLGYFGEREDDFPTDDIAIYTEDHRPQPPKAANPPRE